MSREISSALPPPPFAQVHDLSLGKHKRNHRSPPRRRTHLTWPAKSSEVRGRRQEKFGSLLACSVLLCGLFWWCRRRSVNGKILNETKGRARAEEADGASFEEANLSLLRVFVVEWWADSVNYAFISRYTNHRARSPRWCCHWRCPPHSRLEYKRQMKNFLSPPVHFLKQ